MGSHGRARRGVWIALTAAIGAAVLSPGPAVTIAAAAEPSSESAADLLGAEAVRTYLRAVMSGDPDTIRAVLAPEFQIMRADGSGYDAAGYVASELPIIAAMPDIQNLVATREGDILVTRYFIDVNETRDGKVVESNAPRLTVFRKSGDRWLVVAHGNFAALEE